MNLLKRIIIAIIFIPILLIVFWIGGLPLGIFLALVALMQMWELQKLFALKLIEIPIITSLLSVFVFLSASYLEFNKLLFAYFWVLFSLLATDVIRNRVDGAVARVAAAIFSVSYTGLLLSAIPRISFFPDGNRMIVTLLLLIWITDTFAYFVGMKWGKHRNICKVSPNKSLEGFIAGIIFAFAFGFLFYKIGFIAWKPAFLAAVSSGVIGQFGDLFESLLKRDFGVKDSSQLLPGHGGLLDRFDSLMFAAPVYYFLLLFFRNVL
jgi:phosphatidate cytidylyltransferase